jgi:hypothetical protein
VYFLAPSTHLCHTGRSLGCTGMVLRSASHLAGVTTDCHGRGGAKQLYGVGRPPHARRPTATLSTSDAPETSPFRRTGYSKRWLDPKRVAAHTRNSLGESRPPTSLRPGQNGVGAVSRRLGRRAASVFAGPSRQCVVTGVRRGRQSKATGSGTPPQRGHTGSRPRGQASANAVALFAPVRLPATPAGPASPRGQGPPMSFPFKGAFGLLPRRHPQ